MIKLRNPFSNNGKSGKKAGPKGSVPPGRRIYAIGDIHGRCDLFAALAKAIDKEAKKQPELDSEVILLGDLIDRGPDSAGVISHAIEWGKTRKLRALMGNHEQMLLEALDDTDVMRAFLRYGGAETLLSYGISHKTYESSTLGQLQDLLIDAMPGKHLKFIRKLEDLIIVGDYAFVHAGIHPGVPLDQQKAEDMRWIRQPFLSWTKRHSHAIVHGHTIADEVEQTKGRIGIDTGAYRSGRLTALVLEGESRRIIEAAEQKDGSIQIVKRGQDS